MELDVKTGAAKPGIALWIVQGLLAALFLFAGASKLLMPIEPMVKMTGFSPAFLRFIGVAELAGGLGLVLPGLLRIRPGLTPLAAAGLLVIMIGATALTLKGGQIGPALFPAVVGLLLAFVAWRHWSGAPSARAG